MNGLRIARVAVSAFGVALLVSAGTAAASAQENIDDQNVDVNVDIQEIDEPGVLAMTVESGSTDLTENGSTDLVRQFTGDLPTVTVTDTRTSEEVPDDAFWYVLGTASAFSTDDPTNAIGADHLGWSPTLIAGEGDPAVSVGGDVETVEEGGPGLVDRELLFLGESSDAEGGSWSAGADLVLQVGADEAEPGSYTSLLTLSLFE